MDTKFIDLQRTLRKNMPTPESILWQKIRANQLGVKFRRQYAIKIPHPVLPPLQEGRETKSIVPPSAHRGRLGGGYYRILDFYAPSVKLGIEIDGESHFSTEEKRNVELANDKEIEAKYDIKILRFLNQEVMKNIEEVLELIKKSLT